MDLRLALLLLGIAMVLLVFGISRYSSIIERFVNKIRQLSMRKVITDVKNKFRTGARRRRNTDRAPSLDASEKNTETLHSNVEEELFVFDSDSAASSAKQAEEDNILITPQADTGPESHLEQETVESKEPQVETLASLADDEPDAPHKATGPFTSLRQIDYWIKLSPVTPVTQAEIFSSLRNWDKIDYPVQLHALTQEDPHWVTLMEAQSDKAIMDVVASYQLLFKGSAAPLEDLNTFNELVSTLGKKLGAEKLMMATPEQARAQSIKLEQFFASSCGPLEVTVCASEGQAFMGKLVETSAKQQGLDYLDGQYVRQKRMASDDIILYRMMDLNKQNFDQNMAADTRISGVKFTMIPALSRTPGRDAKEMLDAVKAFASRVKGEIRIPGEPEYHHDQMLKLRNRVSKLEEDTLSAGLEPGGLEISRIFS